MVQLLFFGRLGDVADNQNIPLPDHVKDTEALVAWLGEDDVHLAEALGRPGVSVVVNQTIVRGAAPVGEGDEIAFLAPVSGG